LFAKENCGCPKLRIRKFEVRMHLPKVVFVPDWGRHLMGTLNMALRQLRRVELKMLSPLNGTPKLPSYTPYEIHIEHLNISNHINVQYISIHVYLMTSSPRIMTRPIIHHLIN
jgi:hypothetical protein